MAPETYVDARHWGPRLRYSATNHEIGEFYEFVRAKQAKFTLFGSGDFHHLSALWLRRIAEPFTLVSFDNHPDWDIRPPRWGCGTWINRALELPNLRQAAIWGCGNFELNWPGNLFVNHRALRAQRLEVWPWTERLEPSGRRRWLGVTRANWQDQFSKFTRRLAGHHVYVTVDLDCLNSNESATNWEHGLFTAADIVWALGEIGVQAEIVGGDLCGAYSEPVYARWTQKVAATFDHPRQPVALRKEENERNRRAFRTIWEALTRGGPPGVSAEIWQ